VRDIAAVRVRRYTALSTVYDATIGRRFFRQARRAFLHLARRYGIAPSAAADLGAGTGLFAAWLARRYGIPVYAVERSAPMLEAGACRMLAAGVTPILQDIRELQLPRPVDLAVSNYDTINHLLRPADVKAAFGAIARNLTPGGFFVFDVITPAQAPGPVVLQFRSGRRVRVSQTVGYDPLRRIVRVTVRIHARGRQCAVTERHVERVYSLPALARWLNEAGFRLRGLFDAATVRHVRYASPSRAILVAQRPGPRGF